MANKTIEKTEFQFFGLNGTVSAYPERGQRRYSKGRVFVWVTDESVMENLQNRTTRPTEHYRLIALTALQQLGFDTDSFKLVWSQKAGCTLCPCSPGFVIKPLKESDRWTTAFMNFSVSIDRNEALLNNGTYRQI